MRKTVVFLALLLLGGCGSVSPIKDGSVAQDRNDPGSERTAPAIDTVPALVTAGERQQVAAGKAVLLHASKRDRSLELTRYLWKEGDVILAEGEEVLLHDLTPGVHEITLEAIGKDGRIYRDSVKVEIKADLRLDTPPKATSLHFKTAEDSAFHGALAGSDVDGDPLRYLLVALPEHGTLSGSGAHLTYTPDPDFFGEDRFIFKTNDGTIDSDPATVTIDVEARNDAPVAKSLTAETVEEEAVEIQLQASDVDKDPLTYKIGFQPQHGEAVLEGDKVRYTPNKGFSGTDRFTYYASDGKLDSDAATLLIDVVHVNHLPKLNDLQLETSEDQIYSYQLPSVDSDGDKITYRLLDEPRLGRAHFESDAEGNEWFVYEPNPNLFGTETLRYVANDTHADTPPATMTILITAVNDAPVAQSQSITTKEDQPANFTLAATDIDSDDLNYFIVAYPKNGTIEQNGSDIRYIPNLHFNGIDRLTFQASDGKLGSNVATVEITVEAVNHPPVGSTQTLSTMQDTPLEIILTGSDLDGDTLTFNYTQPSSGTLTGTGNRLQYTPSTGYVGSDSFSYWVSDGNLTSEHYTIMINVTEKPNAKPIADDLNITLLEDQNRSFTLSGYDPDKKIVTFRITTNPQHGSATIVGDTLIYQPVGNYFGDDYLEYVANDGKSDSDPATVRLTIESVNDLPIAYDANRTLNEDDNLSLTLGGSDIESTNLIFTPTQPEHGTLLCNNAECTYKPVADFYGTDRFTFTVTDEDGAVSNSAEITLQIIAQNDAPVAKSDTISLQEDSNKTIILQATDNDGDTVSFEIQENPLHGTLIKNEAEVTYLPEANYNGTDRFTFIAKDSGGLISNIAQIDINVTAVNDIPIANSASLALDEDTQRQITLSGSDIEGDILSYEIVREPTLGRLEGSAPDLLYIPDPNSSGSDYFTFSVSDAKGASSEANVTITINPVNDTPIAYAGADITAALGESVVLDASGSSDIDGDTLTYAWYEGTIALGTGVRLTKSDFTPGIHTITLRVTDSGGLSAEDSVQVTITQSGIVSFDPIASITVGAPIHQLFLKDIDNDAKPDIVIATGTVDSSSIVWYKNEGNFSFTEVVTSVQDKPLQVMAVDDIDADGFADIIFGKDAISICTNDQNGIFSCDFDTLYGGFMKDDNIQAIAVADVDNQYGVDLIVANDAMAEHEIVVYLKDDTSRCNKNVSLTIDSSLYDIKDFSMADNDNDGDIDLLVSTQSGTYYFENDVNSSRFNKIQLDGLNSSKLYFADIDGDMKLDRVNFYENNRTVAWYPLASSLEVNTTLYGDSTDFDLDGFVDILADFNNSVEVAWWKNGGSSANFSFNKEQVAALSTGQEALITKAADLDGDGDADIVIVNSAGEIVIYKNGIK